MCGMYSVDRLNARSSGSRKNGHSGKTGIYIIDTAYYNFSCFHLYSVTALTSIFSIMVTKRFLKNGIYKALIHDVDMYLCTNFHLGEMKQMGVNFLGQGKKNTNGR